MVATDRGLVQSPRLSSALLLLLICSTQALFFSFSCFAMLKKFIRRLAPRGCVRPLIYLTDGSHSPIVSKTVNLGLIPELVSGDIVASHARD